MALVVADAHQLKPEVQLMQALHNFELTLDEEQRRKFHSEGPPDANAATKLTARIDQECSQRRMRCMGPRVTMLLESVLQFSAAADTFVSAHPEVAALVWGGLKLTLLAANNISSYFENLSTLLMNIGRQCPRIQGLGSLYPSKRLQRAWCDYIASVLRLCTHIIETLQKPAYFQLTKALLRPFGAEFGSYKDEIALCCQAVRDEASLASKEAQKVEQELQAKERSQNTRSRDLVQKLWVNSSRTSETYQKMVLDNQTWKLERDKLEILDSLSTYDYQTTYRRIRKQCKPGTSRWICDDPIFRDWLAGPTRTLCFTGKLGSGKSVSCTSVVDFLTQALSPHEVIAYFFCRFDDQESLRAQTILGTILKQFASNLPVEAFKALKQERNSTLALLESVRTILDSKKKYFIVLDGLDECERMQAKDLVDHLQDLLTSSHLHVKVFWTSRSHIASWFPRKLLVQQQIGSESAENQGKVTSDIQKYVRDFLEGWQEDEELPLSQSILNAVQDSLGSKAHGMFLWAKLQLETMREELTINRILSALDDLPEDLSETFRRVLSQQAQKDNEGIGRRIFRWIAVARRPLIVDELREAISIQPLQKTWDPNTLINMSKAIGFCSHLVLVDEECNTLHFTHNSVRQFLLSAAADDLLGGDSIDLEKADLDAGALCVTYLNLPIFNTQVARINKRIVNPAEVVSTVIKNSSPSGKIANRLATSLVRRENKSGKSVHRLLEEAAGEDEESRRRKFLKQYAFRSYAECFWLDHTTHGLNPDSGEMWRLFRNLIEDAEWRNTLVGVPWTSRDWMECSDALLDWIVKHRHLSLARLHRKDSATVPHKFFEERLVRRFVLNENPKALAILLELGSTDRRFLNSGLRTAATGGHLDLVNNLLLRGASHDNEDMDGRTALWLATSKGHADVVDRLLQAGADINHQDGSGETALSKAAESGYTDVVDMILQAGANVNHQNDLGWTALYQAGRKGHKDVVDRLLHAGADINYQDKGGWTALTRAARYGYIDVVNRLLQAGANINCQDKGGWTALIRAARYGHTDVVNRLLQAGANINCQNAIGETAIFEVVKGGHIDVVDRLLQAGANITLISDHGWTALCQAAYRGYIDVVDRLLQAGADINHQDISGETALFKAANEGYIDVVDRLLQAGADINLQKNDGSTTLFGAARKGHTDVVDRLLEAGADINYQDKGGLTALHMAASGGRADVVDKLLQAGADVGRDKALQVARGIGHKKVVALLKKAGAK